MVSRRCTNETVFSMRSKHDEMDSCTNDALVISVQSVVSRASLL